MNPDIFFSIRMVPPDSAIQFWFTSPQQNLISVQLNHAVNKKKDDSFKIYKEVFRVVDENLFTVDKLLTFDVPDIVNERETAGGRAIYDQSYNELVVA